MPQHVHAALSRHIEVYGLGERDLVFTGALGGPLAQGTAGRLFRLACRQVGLGDSVTYHALRHSYASEGLAQGLSTVEVAELIGDSVAMVERIYGHPTVDFKKRARLALEAAWASRSEAVADDARTAGLTRGGGLR
jgi:integrase